MRNLSQSAAIVTVVCLCATLSAQIAAPVARVFHPAPPLPSYDVATIKPVDVAASSVNGRRIFRGSTVREYIRTAYAPHHRATRSLAGSSAVPTGSTRTNTSSPASPR